MEDLLIEAIRQVNKPVEKSANARQHSVVLKMHPPATENFPLVESHIKPIMPGAEFYSVGDSIYLIGLYPERQDADRVERLVKDCFSKFDELLMEELVEDDWLEDYLAQKSLGIDIVMQDSWLTSKNGIEEYLKKEAESVKGDKRYRDSVETSKAMSISYTHEDVISDVLTYADKVFIESTYNKDHLASTLSQSLSSIDALLEGKSMLPKYACQSEMFAVTDMLELLSNRLPNGAIHSSVGSASIYDVIGKATGGIIHEDWKKCSDIMAGNIRSVTADMQFKPEAFEGKGYLDYGFIPFSYDSPEKDMNSRLSPSYINRRKHQGSDLINCLSGGIAAYYMQVLCAKHEMAFRKALHEYSRDINVQTFPADLQDMVESTMPVPANPKKATPKPKG